ncbi:Protein of unknown function [Halopseudomonas sabulinigri]|uniref:DUF3108 domain-containing protein n=1 Tax=Halopseudomonas sabulinigri TaxID=472181 RepID=A0A1H1XFH1_9GAMM|nr:DUF3108 domain-containing protein [Halopseudomonas sabulinigri]SDT08007.1 Protein of unknown function [Halopseudomonas sabulinigri]
MHQSPAFSRRLTRSLLGLALTLSASFASAAPLVPFSASYAADMKRIPVNGEALHSLEANADGTWNLSFTASMFVAKLVEQSTLRQQDGVIQPLSYHYERKGLGSGKEIQQRFDWDNGLVSGTYKEEAFELPTEPNLLDKTTYQLALQQDLMAGKTDMHYRVVDGDEIEDYHFHVVGEDRVTTRVGQFDAVEVERVREPDAKRETTLWFAKDWNYLLVRLSQIETDGQHYQIMLKEATVDGQNVVGTPVKTD